MADNYGVGALGGVVLVDPATGLPYKAEGGGGAVDSVNGQIGAVVLDAEDVGARPDDWTPTKADVGLGNVTDDAQLKASDLDTDPDLTADSDAKVPSQKAVKAYVDANAGGGSAVVSVNGQIGAVVLDAEDVGALPDDYEAPVSTVNGQTGAVVLDAEDVGARADDWVPGIADVTGLTSALSDKADSSDLESAPYIIIWTSQDQERPDTGGRIGWWIGDFENPPDNAIPTDIVTRT